MPHKSAWTLLGLTIFLLWETPASTQRPAAPSEAQAAPARRVVRTPTAEKRALPTAAPRTGGWPSFRGDQASGVADGQRLPDRWDGSTGQNILWRTPIPGLAHSSPIVWGQLVFVTTAVSSDPKATFKPGLYGDGDAAEDRSIHRWMIYLSNEDGEMLVIAAGPKYADIATNSMGDLLMATPALSEGVMYVRSASNLFAIGRKR